VEKKYYLFKNLETGMFMLNDNKKMNFKLTAYEIMDWVRLAADGVNWYENMLMCLRFVQQNFLTNLATIICFIAWTDGIN
jgi:hypothetical protein